MIMLMEAVRAHLKMIGVPCLRMNREVGLQGNPNSKTKDVHDGSAFWHALSTHHFLASKVIDLEI